MSGSKRPRALIVGDVMTDIVARLSGPIAFGSDRRTQIVVRPGGSAATQAVWLARFGVAVDFVGRVGAADHAAESARFRAAGVEPHLAADASLETGRLIAIVEPSGERSFLTDRGANDALSEADIPDALIERADLIHLSGYSFFAAPPRAAVQTLMRRARAPISVDPASAEFLREAGREAFLDWIAGASLILPNAEEAATLSGTDDPEAQGARLAERFPLVVIKRGAAGAEAFGGAQRWRAAAPPARVVDMTGAGDAFAAAFLAARLNGEPMQASLERAVAAGAAATEFLGGRPA